MMAAKLTVLTVLALLGSVSCQAGYRAGNPAPAPQAPTHPPIASQPPSYRPIAPRPSTNLPKSPSPPPPSPPSSTPPPPAHTSTTPQPPSYRPIAPRPSAYSPTNPRRPPPPPARPPTTSQPPSYHPIAPRPSTYPPTSPSPPPPLPPPSTPQPPAYPPTTSQPPSSPPTTPQPPTYPPTSPSPPPPVPPPPPSSDDAGDELVIGYYKDKCGPYVDVEAIVRKHVSAFDAGMKAGIIRMFFHDCFIRGCDASILLDPTSDNPQPEKFGIPNFPSLRGYEVIDAAKAELEAKCPGKVSCADIIAFAARDASFFLSGGSISFDMPAGRYDGNVSLASETLPNLPPPFAGLQQLESMFADRGLDAFDMVTLSGAHSIGRSHCSSFSRDRLPPSTASDMNSTFAAELQANCTSANGDDNTVVQDSVSPDELDNQYYQNVLDKKVLFTSDAALTSQDMTNYLVRVYAIFPWLWQQKYAEAMVKMGSVEIKTATTGEIRKTCRVVNSKP